MSSLLDQAKHLIGVEEKQKEWYEELEDNVCSVCPSLTWSQRLMGCGICFLVGLVLSMGSLFRLMELVKGDPVPFALMYTLGNVVALASTCFLNGPWSQIKKMVAPTRYIATIVYLFMMGMTLFLAFYPGDIPVRVLFVLISIILQFLALVWYTLSFIPFARDVVSQCCSDMCCSSCKKNDSWI